jgi:Circularly permutated YpsA SLOG family
LFQPAIRGGRRSETAAPVKALKIISGGQTGVDRAALDVALRHGIECGGWCPAGRLDEFGKIPDRYPVQELEQGNKEGRSLDRPSGLETAAPWEKPDIFAKRTLQNVRDSNGTVIIHCDGLRAGTAYTVECCKHLQRPHQLIDASKISAEGAVKLIAGFVGKNKIGILNIAGPRQSEWPQGYDYASRALSAFLYNVTRNAALLPDLAARRSMPGSELRTNRLRTR